MPDSLLNQLTLYTQAQNKAVEALSKLQHFLHTTSEKDAQSLLKKIDPQFFNHSFETWLEDEYQQLDEVKEFSEYFWTKNDHWDHLESLQKLSNLLRFSIPPVSSTASQLATEIKREATETDDDEPETAEKLSTSPASPENPAEKQKNSSQPLSARDKQRISVEKAKSAYLSNVAQELRKAGMRMEDKDLINLLGVLGASSGTTVSEEDLNQIILSVFRSNQFALLPKGIKSNVLAYLRSSIRLMRTANALDGGKSYVFPSKAAQQALSQQLLILSKTAGPDVALKVLTVPHKELEKTLADYKKIDLAALPREENEIIITQIKHVEQARSVQLEIFRSIQPQTGIALEDLPNQTISQRMDAEFYAPEHEGKHVGDLSILELLGGKPLEENSDETSQYLGNEKESQPQTQGNNPFSTLINKARGSGQKNTQTQAIEKTGEVAQRALSGSAGPVFAGLGGAAAGTAYSVIQYGVGALPYAAVGGAAGAWGGAQLGAAIGSLFLPGPGTLIGGVIGAGIGGLGGSAAAGWGSTQIIVGGKSLAAGTGELILGAGTMAPGAGAAVGQGLASATPAAAATAQAGLGAAATATGGALNSVLAGTQALLSAIPTIPTALASIPVTTALVAGPAIAGVALTAATVVSITGSFLGPKGGGGAGGIGACWPTDGTITVLEAYYSDIMKKGELLFKGGTPHKTFQPGADAVDIGGERGTQVYTPFAGTALAYTDATGAKLVKVVAREGFTVVSAHLDSFDIPEEQSTTVVKGQPIGRMGDTGNADGVHLHYEVLGKKMNEIVPPSPPLAIGSVVHHDECSGDGTQIGKQCFKDAPQIVTKAEQITSTLEQGVWGMWNYTPLYPQHADYSKPPGVTDYYYDVVLKFVREHLMIPPLEAHQPDDLFWCAWLVTYAYKDATPSVSVPATASVIGQHRQWEKNGRILKNVDEIRPADVPLGSAIGFDKYFSAIQHQTDAHIGLVCHKKFDESGENGVLITCESNNGAISNTINVVNGKVQDLVLDPFVTLRTMWYGLPPQDDPTGKCGAL